MSVIRKCVFLGVASFSLPGPSGQVFSTIRRTTLLTQGPLWPPLMGTVTWAPDNAPLRRRRGPLRPESGASSVGRARPTTGGGHGSRTGGSPHLGTARRRRAGTAARADGVHGAGNAPILAYGSSLLGASRDFAFALPTSTCSRTKMRVRPLAPRRTPDALATSGSFFLVCGENASAETSRNLGALLPR